MAKLQQEWERLHVRGFLIMCLFKNLWKRTFIKTVRYGNSSIQYIIQGENISHLNLIFKQLQETMFILLISKKGFHLFLLKYADFLHATLHVKPSYLNDSISSTICWYVWKKLGDLTSKGKLYQVDPNTLTDTCKYIS